MMNGDILSVHLISELVHPQFDLRNRSHPYRLANFCIITDIINSLEMKAIAARFSTERALFGSPSRTR